MITRGIREFVSRDWQAARDNKDRYWADRIARLGPAEGFRIAEQLRQQALSQVPALAARRRSRSGPSGARASG